MTAAMILAALLGGWCLGAAAITCHTRVHKQIAADTRAALIEDAAEQAIDDEAVR